jgi:diguanylate cyclase (GGDEF)-like protein
MNSLPLAHLQASVKSRTSLALLALGLAFAAASSLWRVGLELDERAERQAVELQLLPLLYAETLARSVVERRDDQTQQLLAAMARRHGAASIELRTADVRLLAVGDAPASEPLRRSEFTLNDPRQAGAPLGSVQVALPAATLSLASLLQDRPLLLQLTQNLLLVLVLGLAAAWLLERMLLRHLRRVTAEMQRFDASQPPSQIDWPAPASRHAPLELRQINAALAHVQQSVDSQLQREQSRALALQQEVERKTVALRHVERELQSKQRELAALSRVDALTGLANRGEFDEALRREFKRAQRQHGKLALAVMDLDAFKAYNRQHGHGAGDAALQRFAHLLYERFKRDTDLVARFGGEEFVALLPGLDQGGAQALLEQLREDLRALGLPNADASGGVLTVSIGLAAYSAQQPYLSSQALLQAADEALAVAKHAGRDRLSLAA